jgi:uncharacterized protein DUF4440
LETVQKLSEAWLRKDQAGMSCWLAEDIIELGSSFRGVLRGKTEFFDKYQPYLKRPPEILSYRMIQPKVVLLSTRFALIYFSYRMKVTKNRKVESSHGKESMLLEKIKGRWLVKCIHWHSDAKEQR